MENPDTKFLPGSRVRVRIPVSDPYQAVLVPDEAVLSDQDQRYLLCLNDENVVVRRNVTLGRLLEDGMRVILPGASEAESSPARFPSCFFLRRRSVRTSSIGFHPNA